MSGKPLKHSSSSLIFASLLLLLLFYFNIGMVRAEANLNSASINVIRTVQVEDGGGLIINETVILSANSSQNVGSIDKFYIGFPSEYERNLGYVFAYDLSGRLEISLDVDVGEAKFYWVEVSFPEVDLSEGGSYNFTVVFVFSRLVISYGENFLVGFPLYPSLTVDADSCNVTVILPPNATYIDSSPKYANATIDSHQVLSITKSPLETLSNASSLILFSSEYPFLIVEIGELKREIKLDGWGNLIATDLYLITNHASEPLYEISFCLPLNATGISVQDIYGELGKNVRDEGTYTNVTVSLREALETGKEEKILIAYRLPFGVYVERSGWEDYILNISLVRPYNWTIRELVVTILLPEGAEFQSSTESPSQLEKDLFQETITFTYYNVTRFHELNLDLKYRYIIFWASLRPTLWAGVIVALISVAFFMRKAPKPEVTVAPPSVEILRKFVEKYEESRRVMQELESLEIQVRKGRIPRRGYKLRKDMLEGRLSRLRKELAEHGKEIEAYGGHYADMIKRLEVAEAELMTLERDMQMVEARFRRGELSVEARGRLLSEYQHRSEQAENTIAEVILRFREEAY